MNKKELNQLMNKFVFTFPENYEITDLFEFNDGEITIKPMPCIVECNGKEADCYKLLSELNKNDRETKNKIQSCKDKSRLLALIPPESMLLGIIYGLKKHMEVYKNAKDGR